LSREKYHVLGGEGAFERDREQKRIHSHVILRDARAMRGRPKDLLLVKQQHDEQIKADSSLKLVRIQQRIISVYDRDEIH